MDLGGWLRSLCLEQYEAAFRENAIDDSVLPNLTAKDLKELGVDAVGHRRKLLNAIAALHAHANTKAARSDSLATIDTSAKESAERRQVTVMFSDLVGSTALSARMDAENLREVISIYQKCVAETVRRFDGLVARYMGDGVLIYFGYPQAHEDDAERAVRAGLELITAVSALKSRASLKTRVGIATGLVVVGDLIDSGDAQERRIVGETPNVAARLQEIASPNMVVICDSTRRLLGNLFELEDLGPRELNGIAGSARVWTALRGSSVASRFEALRAPALTALVGRQEELEVLLRRWSRAKSGEGQVVLLTGEAGIGKSRLAAAFQELLKGDRHTRLHCFCSPHHQDSALNPLIGQLERGSGFARDDTADEKLIKLEALLAQSNAQPDEIGFIAELLSIANAARYPLPELSPQKRKERRLMALLAQLERLAARQPVLSIYEDVQWIDPTTLELLTLAIERARDVPALLLIAARPEFKEPWPAYAHLTKIILGRFSRDDGALLIRQIIGDKALPDEVLQQILTRTDGVPLFIEELTKSVVESGVLTDAGDCYTLTGPLPSLAIPTSLSASLLARLDRLAPVREVAQIGAALGRKFSHELVSAVAEMPQEQLDDALAQLVNSELVFRRGAPPEAEYSFKHTLVQDTAYDTMLRSRRQRLHGRIAATLKEKFPEIVQTQPEVLARHCAEGGLVEEAVGHWNRAGQQSIARWAITEAVAQLRKGLDLLSGLPTAAWRLTQELELLIALGNALLATKGYAAPEPGEAFDRARRICQQLDLPPQLESVLIGQYSFGLVRGELRLAEDHAAKMRWLSEIRNDVRSKRTSSSLSGNICFYLGKFKESRTHYENAVCLRDPVHRAFVPSPAHGQAWILIHFYNTLVCLGYVDQARFQRDAAMAQARRRSPYTLASTLCLRWFGDWMIEGAQSPQTTLRSANEVLAISREQGFPFWLGIGNVMHGWCLSVEGQTATGIQLVREGLAIYRATGSNLVVPFFLTILAELYGLAGQPEEGLNRLDEAAQLIDRTQERWAEAEMHRQRGMLLLSINKHAAAEGSYRHALSVAQGQDAKLWELRAARDLARLWRDQGKRPQARDLLASVYGWFTEGFDTLDLKQSKALLEELAS
jgi:class 3 adenylate cyclase/tetratricopeptide (TPR) repeat protein